ncbi:MAG: hypothetical protein HY739_05165 [Desulfobacterales bacterium]|nr:hypothetical protein [Desulfobacterales bacterium]
MRGKNIIISMAIVFFLFSLLLKPTVASEENISSYHETISVLRELYKDETTAYKTYSVFAKKAMEEKYDSVARLFSALSESESVHARNFKSILEEIGVTLEEFPEPDIKVKTTKKNLKFSLNTELSEIDTTYPGFIERIKPEGNERALVDITYAWKAEMQHRDLIKGGKSAIWLLFGKIAEDDLGTLLLTLQNS